MSLPFRQSLSREQALQKIKHYCAYQERCHQEVKEKLYELGLYKKDVEEVTAQLIDENYLNEERFAIQYAGGKFRIKHWGRIKIKYSLKQKQVSEYNIKKAMTQIEGESYMQTLEKLCQAKWEIFKNEKNRYVKKRKTQDYLLQKGYESDLVREVINSMQDDEK
ncbi:MAG: RecX family transcriptional regulator [Chitinophagaceae bacterium]